jgi:pimeloyl-ACP methyl ester carboxylesterase
MKDEMRKHWYWLIGSLAIVAFCAIMAYAIRRDFGRVDIQPVRIADESGAIVAANLFRPVAASPGAKMPGVLVIHGYSNDKDTEDSFSIELARRGFVVLAPDFLGHGESGGWADPMRFMFGKDPKDTYSIGSNSAYLYLKNLPFVDAANLGIMGHSMGGIATQKLAAMNPDHKALNPHASILLPIPGLHDLLFTEARFDEFLPFRAMQLRTENLVQNPAWFKALGLGDQPVQWDTTYGDFAKGTARRVTLINMDHHFTPITNKAVAEAVDWMRLSLKGGEKDALWVEPTSQIFMWKEVFMLIAFLAVMLSLIPLASILLATRYFAKVSQPMPTKYVASTGKWWLFASINALIGAILYSPLTAIVFPFDMLKLILPFMHLQMGNGFVLWFLANAIVCAVLFTVWYRSAARKAGISMGDLGMSLSSQNAAFDWGVLGKTLLLSLILLGWLYILTSISEWLLGQDFRFVWAFMKIFATPARFGLFWIYLIPTLIYFLVNGGFFLFGQIRQKEYDTPVKSQFMWWFKILYAALAGLLLLWAFQYLPILLGGPGYGFEITGFPQFSGMWPLWLQIYLPEFAFLLFLLVWFFRQTGRVYLGALTISGLLTWFMAAGQIVIK